jgi:hypothetical protein
MIFWPDLIAMAHQAAVEFFVATSIVPSASPMKVNHSPGEE